MDYQNIADISVIFWETCLNSGYICSATKTKSALLIILKEQETYEISFAQNQPVMLKKGCFYNTTSLLFLLFPFFSLKLYIPLPFHKLFLFEAACDSRCK